VRKRWLTIGFHISQTIVGLDSYRPLVLADISCHRPCNLVIFARMSPLRTSRIWAASTWARAPSSWTSKPHRKLTPKQKHATRHHRYFVSGFIAKLLWHTQRRAEAAQELALTLLLNLSWLPGPETQLETLSPLMQSRKFWKTF
jgi:hypothetical protein